MKMVIAIVKPKNFDKIKEELYKEDFTSLTITNVKGHGRQMGHKEVYRGREYYVEFLDKVKIEIVVSDDKLNKVIEIIERSAKTDGGAIGDGKIFVLPVENVIRIRTGERGDAAV